MAENSVRGRVVLITGAARGLGAGLATSLADLGAKVALVGLEPEELARQAERCGPDATWWQADVVDQAQISDVADRVAAHYGGIDIAVVNAGVASGGTLRTADPEAYDRVVEVNLLGSIRTARAVVEHLVASRGYLLQIASLAALLPAPVLGSYAASKSGAEAFANVLMGELKRHGVRVGVAYLAFVGTDMVRGMEEQPALRVARAALPWPTGNIHPVTDAVATLTAGVLRRRRRIFFPGWVGGLYLSRAFSPPIVNLIAGRPAARRLEQAAAEDPGSLRGLTGPGGAAASGRDPAG